MKVYSDPQGIEGIKDERPYIKSVGKGKMMRFQRGQFALFFFLNSIAAVYERLYRKNKGLGHS